MVILLSPNESLSPFQSTFVSKAFIMLLFISMVLLYLVTTGWIFDISLLIDD